jgi:hypothetical protein
MVIEHLGTNHADEIVSLDTSHTTMQPLTQDLIEEALKAIGVNYTRDQDNDLFLVIPGEKIPWTMLCWFLIEEHAPSIFTLYCRVFPAIPQRQWPEALAVCNDYATRYRFGRFQLRMTAEQREANLCFVSQLDLSDGTTVAFAHTFILSHLSSACAFLGEAAVQQRLLRAPTRQRNKNTHTKEVLQND